LSDRGILNVNELTKSTKDLNEVLLLGVELGTYMRFRGGLESLEKKSSDGTATTDDLMLLKRIQDSLHVLATLIRLDNPQQKK
jgi:hypothetical protein